MTLALNPRTATDPLAAYTLDALLEGAAGLRPGGIALCGPVPGEALSFAGLAEQAGRFAGHLRAMGLEPGETLALAGGNKISTVVALMGSVRAGVNVVMVPPAIRADQLAMIATQTGVSALLCGVTEGAPDVLDKAFDAAALSDAVRFVGTLEGQHPDAADFSPQALADTGLIGPPGHCAEVATLWQASGRCTPVVHPQRVLVAAALNLIARVQMVAEQPIVSTLAPHGFAGLVAGPIAALLCGASLHLHDLFSGAGLLAQLAQAAQAQLIVPARLLPALAQGGLLEPDTLSGVIALSRWRGDGSDFVPPHHVRSHVPVLDMHAFGEGVLVPEPRGTDGSARALLDPPHQIELGGTQLAAVDADEDLDGHMRFFGAAVSERGQR